MTVGRWIKEKKTEIPDVVGRMEHAFMEAGAAFKNHDHHTCEPIVEKLEEVIRRVRGQQGTRGTTGTQSPRTDVPTTTTTTPPTEEAEVPPPTRQRGGSVPPQPQTRARSVTAPGEIPDSPARRAHTNFDNAKQEVDAFKANPNAGLQTPEARQKIGNLKNEMRELLEGELAAEDDIKRKGILFDSTDANYKKDVTDLVKRTMDAIRPALDEPANDPVGPIQTLDEAIAALAIARAHYADTSGITDKKHLDQRRRKVEAIEVHQAEFKKIADKLRQICKMKAQPVLDMLNATKALNDADPGAGGPELKKFSALLADDATRKAVFQSVGPEHQEALLDMLQAQEITQLDKLSSELAKTRAADSEFMDGFCKTAILREGAKATDKGTFFRGNSLATKLAANYVSNSPAGKAYCKSLGDKFTERTKGKGPMEVDPAKDTKLKPKDIENNFKAQKKLLGPMIDDLTSDPGAIPPEMAKIAGIFFDEAKRVTGDEEFATTQAGGFAMLRIVIPTVTRIAAENTNAQKSDSARTKAANDQRLVMLQTKVLQNISNGVRFDKEPFMKPFEDQIFGEGDEYAPPANKLRGFLKSMAENAPRG